ncbi:hypothetical protein D3C85_1641910 [compost metagenome]
MEGKELFSQPTPHVIRHGRIYQLKHFLNEVHQIMRMALLIDQDSLMRVEWPSPVGQHARRLCGQGIERFWLRRNGALACSDAQGETSKGNTYSPSQQSVG